MSGVNPQLTAASPRIGFIGLGRMGFALAASLVRKGFSVRAFDLAAAQLTKFAELGGGVAASAADAARGADILFLMLPGPKEVRAVALGPDGVLAALPAGSIVVDMSTVDPATADALAAAAAERGLRFADAPVGRLAAHADRGESLFMLGADADVLEAVQPCLNAMGTTIYHCGPAGHGTRTKLVNNFMVLAYCQLNSEALVLAQGMGLDLAKTLAVLTGTTAVNGQLKEKWPVKVLRGDLTPGFDMALALKDITLACQAAQGIGLAVPLGSQVRDLMALALNGGHRGQDTSALTDFWARLNNQAPLRLT